LNEPWTYNTNGGYENGTMALGCCYTWVNPNLIMIEKKMRNWENAKACLWNLKVHPCFSFTTFQKLLQHAM